VHVAAEPAELGDHQRHLSGADALVKCQQGDTMTNLALNAWIIERPKYPPPPRSGNGFAAAVFAAIPGLLLLAALIGAYAR
jgi:hypothetical protein